VARAFYANSLTIPASTTWEDPEELVFELPSGTILEWHIHGAPEHQHQVSIAIYHTGHRVFPEGEGEYFYPSEYPAVFSVGTMMVPGIRHTVVRGANTDDTYEHTVYIGITVDTVSLADRLLAGVRSLFVPSEVVEE
jgi:hypothetical protein